MSMNHAGLYLGVLSVDVVPVDDHPALDLEGT